MLRFSVEHFEKSRFVSGLPWLGLKNTTVLLNLNLMKRQLPLPQLKQHQQNYVCSSNHSIHNLIIFFYNRI